MIDTIILQFKIALYWEIEAMNSNSDRLANIALENRDTAIEFMNQIARKCFA